MTKPLTKYLFELDFRDKSEWESGEWHQEPDKLHWIDTVTNYPCLIIRGEVTGSLNGYVGIPVYHPAYGLSYDGETYSDHVNHHLAFMKAMRNRDRSKSLFDSVDFDKLPEKPIVPIIGEKIRSIEVHGGLTYAGPTQEPTKKLWETAKATIPYHTRTALQYPMGESADWIKEWMPIINDYEKWAKAVSCRSISNANSSDELDENWWFGFDCGHCMDVHPAMDAILKKIRHRPIKPIYEIPEEYGPRYRNVEYVEKECESLAKQLKELE